MHKGFATLPAFSENELVIDEAETRDILKFIFQRRQSEVDATNMSNAFRAFAQGLLIEAVDATYALGFIEIIFRSSFSPSVNMQKALKKLQMVASKIGMHCFKHASQKDFMSAKISSFVRDTLARNFATPFDEMLNGIASATQAPRVHVAFVNYGSPSRTDSLWG